MRDYLTPIKMVIIKIQQITNGKNVEKLEPLCTAGGNG